MGKGQGWGSAFAIAPESTYATAGTSFTYIPIVSESLKVKRPSLQSPSLHYRRPNTHHLPGIQECAGNFVMLGDGALLGYPLLYLNGQVSSAIFAQATTLVAGAPSAGGTIPDGAYYYKVATVLQRTADSKYFIASPSAASSQVTCGSGDNTVGLTWANPTIPAGFTQAGTAIYRTAAGGAASTVVFLDYNSGTGTSYSDDGDPALGTAVPPAATYMHTFLPATPTAGTHPLPSFTVKKLLDQSGTSSEQYVGGRMGSMQMSVGDPNAAVQFTFEMMARNATLVSNPSPSFSDTQPMMNWGALLSIDGGAQEALFEGFELNFSNELETVTGLTGNPYHRDFYAGLRNITGSVTFGFEDHSEWTRMNNATELDLLAMVGGDEITPLAEFTDGITATSMLYSCDFHLPRCLYQEGGGNISGPNRMVETLPFNVAFDVTDGYDLRIRLWNTTASYS